MQRAIPRRQLLVGSSAALLASGYWSEQPAAAGNSPLQRLQLGAIGVGNRGAVSLQALQSQRIVALCDVDQQFLDQQRARFQGARHYRDFRELLQREDLDGVVVSTPDHTHFHAANVALDKQLHVYCEKPLAHSIGELRALEKKARQAPQVATQMGNQHHSSPGYREAVDWLRSGNLGSVREIHCWTSRPLWPQGGKRPASADPPANLDWNLWLGPAPQRPYAAGYHPFQWRGWWDFGGGALADMGPHLLSPVVEGLELGPVKQVNLVDAGETTGEGPPAWSILELQFAARAERPAVRLHWYDGGRRPKEEITGARQPPSNGCLVIGERGKLFIPQLGRRPLPLANDPQQPLEPPPRRPVQEDSHYENWLAACRDPKQTTRSPFEQAARLTELCLVGNLALRSGQSLRWDAAAMKALDNPRANQWVTRDDREW